MFKRRRNHLIFTCTHGQACLLIRICTHHTRKCVLDSSGIVDSLCRGVRSPDVSHRKLLRWGTLGDSLPSGFPRHLLQMQARLVGLALSVHGLEAASNEQRGTVNVNAFLCPLRASKI